MVYPMIPTRDKYFFCSRLMWGSDRRYRIPPQGKILLKHKWEKITCKELITLEMYLLHLCLIFKKSFLSLLFDYSKINDSFQEEK